MIGNLIPNWFQRPGPKYLWIPVTLRLLLVPFFLFCNYKEATRQWPVLIGDDYMFIVGGVVLGLSTGYFSSLSMMYAPQCVEGEEKPTAGMMAACFLILGIFMGVNSSFALSAIVDIDFF
jgi:equilibrative nucleoside transporter 1/2/3